MQVEDPAVRARRGEGRPALRVYRRRLDHLAGVGRKPLDVESLDRALHVDADIAAIGEVDDILLTRIGHRVAARDEMIAWFHRPVGDPHHELLMDPCEIEMLGIRILGSGQPAHRSRLEPTACKRNRPDPLAEPLEVAHVILESLDEELFDEDRKGSARIERLFALMEDDVVKRFGRVPDLKRRMIEIGVPVKRIVSGDLMNGREPPPRVVLPDEGGTVSDPSGRAVLLELEGQVPGDVLVTGETRDEVTEEKILIGAVRGGNEIGRVIGVEPEVGDDSTRLAFLDHFFPVVHLGKIEPRPIDRRARTKPRVDLRLIFIDHDHQQVVHQVLIQVGDRLEAVLLRVLVGQKRPFRIAVPIEVFASVIHDVERIVGVDAQIAGVR